MDPMLQWQSHITDSTDRDTILSNIGVLQQFAGAITGDDSLNGKFDLIRTGIKDGTIKPTEWQTSAPFVQITSKLKESSSGKIKALGDGADKLSQRLTTAEGDIEKKLDKETFNEKVKSFATSSEFEHLRTLIDREVSHWTRETTPEPLEYTTLAALITKSQPWELGDAPERHIGDLCTVIGEGQPDKGVSYRFVKHPDKNNNTYKWTKVIDNDGILALNQHREFVTQYNERQNKLDEDSNKKQSSIDDLLEKYKNVSGNLETQGENIEGQRQEIEELKKIYKISVTTKGYIKDGAIKDGTTYNSKPAIAHTAHVYTLTGKPVVKGLDTTLTWTINKGRTTKPVARTVTGVTCYVTADDFVNDGTNPHYYDVELNSTF